MEHTTVPPIAYGQVQVHLTTTFSDIELPEAKQHFLVPINISRYGLSQVLNSESMLATRAPIPFEFLIDGTFLRVTLEEYLTASGLSSETTLTLQYIRSLIPPTYEASFEHDDWVSSVDVLSASSVAASCATVGFQKGQERILSGSYDGLLRVWNSSGQIVATSGSSSFGGHKAGVKSAKFISSTKVVSAGLDRTIRLWKYMETEDHFSGTFKPVLELYGHRGAIESISVHGSSNRILSASVDGTIGLWAVDKHTAPPVDPIFVNPRPTTKRRKLTVSISTPQRGPLTMLEFHTGPATAVIFNPLDATVAYSSSQDHTIRTYDLTTSKSVDSRSISHPPLCLTALPGIGSQLVAAGTSARHITLLDPRISAQSTQVMTLRGHTNKVVSVAEDVESNYGLVSGSHDGSCRIWDLRSSRIGTKDEGGGMVSEAVYIIERESHKGDQRRVGGEGIKVFCVQWNKEMGIVSGGEDRMVQINRGRGVSLTSVA